jgi:hypothetical protein
MVQDGDIGDVRKVLNDTATLINATWISELIM